MNCFTNFIPSFCYCCSTEQLLFQLYYVAAEKLQLIILLLAVAWSRRLFFTLKRDWRCCARDLLDAALKLVCYYNLLDDQTYSNLKRFAAMMEACCHVNWSWNRWLLQLIYLLLLAGETIVVSCSKLLILESDFYAAGGSFLEFCCLVCAVGIDKKLMPWKGLLLLRNFDCCYVRLVFLTSLLF